FNEYYANVGSNLANAIPPVTEVVVNDEDYQIDSVFQFSPVSLEQLEKSVLDLIGGSAPGVDGIHTKSEYDDPLSTPRLKKLVSRSVGPRPGPWTFCLHLKKGVQIALDGGFVTVYVQVKAFGILLDSNLTFCDHHITRDIQHLGRLRGLYGFRNLLQEFT
ncbi:hypothetical protein J6590_099272, partial [Homalodisca vitripennis]